MTQEKKVRQYKSYIMNKWKHCTSTNCNSCVFDSDELCDKNKFNNDYTLNYAKNKLSELRKNKIKNLYEN